jgi:hypothetical protein
MAEMEQAELRHEKARIDMAEKMVEAGWSEVVGADSIVDQAEQEHLQIVEVEVEEGIGRIVEAEERRWQGME